MANIIDALLLTLSLDPSGYTKGTKEVEANQKKLRDDSERTAKQLDAQSKKTADGIAEIRDQVIGLFAVFTAGKGLKEFVADLTASDSALGRTAQNIGISTEQLSLWQGAAARAGGSAQGITSSMQSLSQQVQTLSLTGKSGIVPWLQSLHVGLVDANGAMKSTPDLLLDIADAFQKNHISGARAQAFGAGLGLTEDTINILVRGRAALQAYLDGQKAVGFTTEEDKNAAQARQEAFRTLGQAAVDLGRKMVTVATPAIIAVTHALTQFAEWARQHQDFVKATFVGLTAAVVTFTAVLAAPIAGLAAMSAAIGLAIAGIAVLYDDWKGWTSGAQSDFGQFWQFFSDKWHEIGTIAGPALETLTRLVGDSLSLVRSIFFGTSDDIRRDWSDLAKDLAKDIGGIAKSAWDAIPSIEDANKSIINGFKFLIDGLLKDIGRVAHFVNTVINGAAKIITGHALLPESWEGNAAPAAPENDTVAPEQNGSKTALRSITDRFGKGARASARDVADDIKTFIGYGWSREQASGIAANIQRESSGNTSVIGDNGQAYGLAQWHPDRQADFARLFGHSIRESTRDEQLMFINYELTQGSRRAAGDRLRGAQTGAEAGAIVSQYYEAPADKLGEARLRGDLAQSYLDPNLRASAATGLDRGGDTNNANSQTNSVTIENINLNGTNVTDSKTFANTVGDAVRQRAWVGQANYALI